ncbi:HET-domain-containing protein, partial [Setomelanomma holmii]
WIDQDASSHHEISSARSALPDGFRVIDIELGCIMKVSSDCQYAALSYVWGQKYPEEIEATLDNLDALCTPGHLYRIDLPKTIVDAISLCQKLSISYLWVDRLCIVQDDAAQKHDQISAMDAIYSSAVLTICAAAGNSSRSGLPGVGITKRPFSRMNLALSDIEIVPILTAFRECLADGQWLERGWTFQESLLGGRLLIFTDWQIFY